MAITYVGSTTAGTNGAGTATLNVPAGVQDNDLMLVWAGVDSGTANISATNTTWAPTGWTKLRYDNDGSSVTVGLICYYRIASSEPASYNWTAPGSDIALICRAYRGVDTTTPIETSNGATANGTTATTINAPTITPTGTTDLLLLACATDQGGGTPATITINADATGTVTNCLSTGGLVRIAVNDGQLVGNSATGTITSTASSATNWAGQQIALKPASAPTQPAIVQTKAGNNGTGGSTVATGTLTSQPVSGNFLVAFISARGDASVSGFPNANWSLRGSQICSSAGNTRLSVCSATAGAGEGTTGYTFTINSGQKANVVLYEVSGTSGFDQDAFSQTASSTAFLSTASITPGTPGGLLLAAFTITTGAGAATPATGWFEDADVSNGTQSTYCRLETQHRDTLDAAVATTGGVTWSSGAIGVTYIGSFAPGGGGGPTDPFPLLYEFPTMIERNAVYRR